MKNVILSVAMLLILGSNTTATAQRHRHTPRTETVATTPGNANQQQPAAKTQSQADADDEGIEAFSDTTTCAMPTRWQLLATKALMPQANTTPATMTTHSLGSPLLAQQVSLV